MSKSKSSKQPTSPEDRGECAKFREYQEGATRRDPVVDRWVGQIDRGDESLMQAITEAYDRCGESFRATEIYDRLRRASANRNASRAIKQGDMFSLQNIIGETSNRRDISGLRTIMELRETLSRPAYVCYLHGLMGSGKTDLAFLMAEVWEDEMTRRGHHTVVASNVSTCRQTETIESFEEFDAWLDDATEDERRLFIFDEASSHASGYASDAQEARNLLGKTINLIRKSYASIILVGHTGRDVHADIRRKTTHIMRKESEKKLQIRERTDEGDGEGSVSTTSEIAGIPPTNWDYDTYESASWSWDHADEDDEEDSVDPDEVERVVLERVAQDMRDAGMTVREVADHMDRGRSWVSRHTENPDN